MFVGGVVVLEGGAVVGGGGGGVVGLSSLQERENTVAGKARENL